MPGNLIGHHVEVRADRALVKVFFRGQLIKVHPRNAPGGRVTDAADLPSERTAYALRDIDHLKRLAAGHGPAVGAYAAALLDIPLPWTRMRQVYALLGLVKQWGPSAVDAACARALEAEAVNVSLIGRMLERATENDADRRAVAGQPHRGASPAMPSTSPSASSRPSTPLAATGERVAGGAISRRPSSRPCCDGSSSAAPRHPARAPGPGPHRGDGPRRVPGAGAGRRGHPPGTSSRHAPGPGRGARPDHVPGAWDDTAAVTYDRQTWAELCSLRFVDGGHNVVIMGPVGVGKTFLATALGHAAVRRRYSVHFERCRPHAAPAAGQPPRQQPRRRDAQAAAGRPARSSTTSPSSPSTPPTPPTSTS